MKYQRTVWLVLVVFSLSAYLFLEDRQRSFDPSDHVEGTEELMLEAPTTTPAAHPDLWLIRKGAEQLVKLLPAS